MSTSTSLPHTSPNDERAGVGTLFAGIAVPYIVGTFVICAGLVVGGTVGFAMAYGTLLLLAVGVVIGLMAFIGTDEEDYDD